MEIKEQIKNFIAQNLLFSDDGFEYEDNASFLEEGIVDSLGVMELVNFAEENFGLSVDDHDITPENFDSVEKLANYIQRQLKVSA